MAAIKKFTVAEMAEAFVVGHFAAEAQELRDAYARQWAARDYFDPFLIAIREDCYRWGTLKRPEA